MEIIKKPTDFPLGFSPFLTKMRQKRSYFSNFWSFYPNFSPKWMILDIKQKLISNEEIT